MEQHYANKAKWLHFKSLFQEALQSTMCIWRGGYQSINISDSGIVRPGSEIFHFHNWLSGMYCYGTQSERKYVFMQWSPTMLYMKA